MAQAHRTVPPEELTDLDERRLIELSQFALSRGLQSLREQLLEFLVLQALDIAHLTDLDAESSRSVESIAEAIGKNNELSDAYPLPPLREALGRLTEQQFVVRSGSGAEVRYRLASDLRNWLSDERRRITELHGGVIQRFLASVHEVRSLDAQQDAALTKGFYRFFGQMFDQMGYRAAAVLVSDSVDIPRSDLSRSFGSNVRRSFIRVHDRELTDAIRRHLRRMISEPSGEESKFIYILAQSYLLAAVLHLDPTLQRVSHDILQKLHVWLDTSVAMTLLLGDSRYHSADVELISAGIRSGIRFIVSDRTLEEMSATIRGGKFARHTLPILPEEIAIRLEERGEEGFATKYARDLRNSGARSWADYRDVTPDDLSSLLRSLYGVTFMDDYSFPSPNEDQHAEVTLAIRLAWEDNHPITRKSDNAVEHDAYMYELLRTLRGRGEPDSRRFLIVTADQSLFYLSDHLGQQSRNNIYLSKNALLQIELPFITSDLKGATAANAFSEVLASTYFTSLPELVSTERLVSSIQRWVPFSDLDEGVASNLDEIVETAIEETAIDASELAERSDKLQREIEDALIAAADKVRDALLPAETAEAAETPAEVNDEGRFDARSLILSLVFNAVLLAGLVASGLVLLTR